MWLITPIGFFSIVRKPDDQRTGTLTVRARVRGDLEALRELYLPGLGRIEESHETDYRFRAKAPRSEVSAAMARLIDDLDYSNFKSEVGKQQGNARAKLYGSVWSSLYKLQTDPTFTEAKHPAGVSGRTAAIREAPQTHPVSSAADNQKHRIVLIGAEGGEIALVGVKIDTGWKFRIETAESTASVLLDKDDHIVMPERPWVATWRAALKQLDDYPWPQLFPLEIHPEFRDQVLKALKAREQKGLDVDWASWHGANRADKLGSGFASQVEAAGDKPILASLNVTSDLLRVFIATALSRRESYLQGNLDAATAQAFDLQDARDLADLFMARGQRAQEYFIQPWNSAEQLGQWLIDTYAMQCTQEESVFTVVLGILTEVYNTMDDIAQRSLNVVDEGWRLDGIIESYAHALTGIPYPADED